MFQRQIVEMKADAKKKFDEENLFLKYQVFFRLILNHLQKTQFEKSRLLCGIFHTHEYGTSIMEDTT